MIFGMGLLYSAALPATYIVAGRPVIPFGTPICRPMGVLDVGKSPA